MSFGLLEGLASERRQFLGGIRPTGRILSGVRQQTPSLHNANGADIQHRSGQTGSLAIPYSGIISEERYREGVTAQHPRLLQPYFLGAEKNGGHEAGYRPQCPQSVHKIRPISYGDGRVYSGFIEAGDVDFQRRPFGRILPHPHSSSIEEIPQAGVSRGGLSVSGPPLRGENRPVVVYDRIQRGQAHGLGFRRASPPVYGRLVGDGYGCPDLQDSGFCYDSPLQGVGHPCQPKEIRPGAKTGLRLSGLPLQPDHVSGMSNCGQHGQSYPDGPVVGPGGLIASSHVASPDRCVSLSGQVDSIRSSTCPTFTAPFVEQMESVSWQSPGSRGRSVACQTDGLLVDDQIQPDSGASSRPSATNRKAVYRRQHGGLGGSLRGTGVLRPLVAEGEAFTHQCVGDASHSIGSGSSQALLGGPGFGVHGQLYRGGLYQPPRGDSVSASLGRDQSSVRVFNGPSGSTEGGSHSGPAECHSRPIVPGWSDPPHGVVDSAGGSAGSVPPVGQTISRSVCDSTQPQMRSVCVPSARSSGSGNGRPIIRLGRDLGIRLSSPSNHDQGLEKIPIPPRVSSYPNCPKVAKTGLVPGSHGAASGALANSMPSQAAQAATDAGVPPLPRDALSARLAAERQALSVRGFSREASRRIVAPQRASTLAVYEGKWKVFSDWCGSLDIDPFLATIPQLADFLVYLFQERRLAPSTVEGYRTSLAGALRHRLEVGRDKDLTALIQSFYQERPRVRRIIPSWDLSLVLLALTKPPFEPMRTAELKWCTLKTLFLTLLASGSRRGEIHAVSMAKFRHDEQWRWVTLEPHQGFVAKTQMRKSGASVLAPIRIPALSSTLAPELQEDRALCPVRALKIYLSRTQTMRVGKELLFISFLPSHRGDICKNTISGWVRNLLCKCYEEPHEGSISMSNTRTHELRALSASLAFRGNIDMEDIMVSCSWRSHSTFSSFYLRDVSAVQGQLYTLGPLVVAQSVIQPPGEVK